MACGQSHPGFKVDDGLVDPRSHLLIGIPATCDLACNAVHRHAPRSNRLPLRLVYQRSFLQNECRLLHCCEHFSPSFFPLPNFSSPDHGFCDGCMRDWPESNRVGPQRGLRQWQYLTCRKPVRESYLGYIFVETVMLDEDAEYQARLVNAITEQMNPTRDSVRVMNLTSSAVRVTRSISGIIQS